jgi:hypothetical protein
MEILKQPDWHDFGPTFASEQLAKRHQIRVGKETLRGWMIEAGLWKPGARRIEEVHCWRAAVVRPYLTPPPAGSILVSVRSTFGDAYYTFFNPSDTTATQQTLTLPMTNVIFPFSNFGSGIVEIQSIIFYVVLTVSAGSISASFNPTGDTPTPGSLPLKPVSGQNALTASFPPAPPLTPPLALPQSFTLTVPAASVPSGLSILVSGQPRLDPTKIEDILLIVNYSIK